MARIKDDSIIARGDYIKTEFSDNTLVIERRGDDCFLFIPEKKKYIEANGFDYDVVKNVYTFDEVKTFDNLLEITKSWCKRHLNSDITKPLRKEALENIYESLKSDVFEEEDMQDMLGFLMEKDYKAFIKGLIGNENDLDTADEKENETLENMYQKYIESDDASFLNPELMIDNVDPFYELLDEIEEAFKGDEEKPYSLDIVNVTLKTDSTRLFEEPIDAPDKLIDVLGNEIKYLSNEAVIVGNLSTNGHLLNASVVGKGTLNASFIEPRMVFTSALLSNANSVIILHNHPSGSLVPSQEDIVSTRRLIGAGKLVRVEVLDHVIVAPGNDNFCSLRREREDLWAGFKNPEEVIKTALNNTTRDLTKEENHIKAITNKSHGFKEGEEI